MATTATRPELLTATAAAARLRVSDSTIGKLRRRGSIPAVGPRRTKRPLAALIAEHEPDRFGRAGVRWHGRFALEAKRLNLPNRRLTGHSKVLITG